MQDAGVDDGRQIGRPQTKRRNLVDQQVDLRAQRLDRGRPAHRGKRAVGDKSPGPAPPFDQTLGLEIGIDFADRHRRDARLIRKLPHRWQRRPYPEPAEGNLMFDGTTDLLAQRDGQAAIDSVS